MAERISQAFAGGTGHGLLAGYNLVYTKGESTDAVLGLMRFLMEADVLCDLAAIWLLGGHRKWFDIIRRDVVSAKLDALGVAAEVSRLVLKSTTTSAAGKLRLTGSAPDASGGPRDWPKGCQEARSGASWRKTPCGS